MGFPIIVHKRTFKYNQNNRVNQEDRFGVNKFIIAFNRSMYMITMMNRYMKLR